MLKIISEMITSYVAGAVLIFVGIYFKRHVYYFGYFDGSEL